MDKGLDAMMAQNLRKPPMEGFFIPSPEACFAAQPLIAARGRVATPRARTAVPLRYRCLTRRSGGPMGDESKHW